MAGLLQKIRTFATHGDVRRLYTTWAMHKLRGKEMWVNLPAGARGFATSKFNDFYGIWVQHPTEAEFQTFAHLLGTGGVYFDIGANMGLTTVVAARAGEPSRIVAFEPTHKYAAVWHKNVEANGVRNASLFQCAVGESPGTLDFVVNPNAPMHNRFNMGESLSRYARTKGDAVYVSKVAVTTIDSVCASLGIERITLLKIDVEGAEPSVLRGATQMLKAKAIDTIYMEFIPEFMIEMKESVEAFADTIYGFGYVALRIESNGALGSQMTSSELAARKFEGLNVVLRPSR
jgi:FkbM family methyltransferase